MTNQELCLLLDTIVGLLETGNTDKAIKIIKNGIARIDRGYTASSDNQENVNNILPAIANNAVVCNAAYGV